MLSNLHVGDFVIGVRKMQEIELTNFQKKNIQISTQFWRKFNKNRIFHNREIR